VIVTQGSIRMTGDKMRANFDENRQLTEVFLDGQPAYFKQTPDGGKEDIEGEGAQIQYLAKKNQLILIKDARLTQGARLFTGYRINYDTRRSVITGRGTPQQGETPAAGGTAQTRGRILFKTPPTPPAPPPP
jgi:lipopolysaccharide export system protein LptA